MAEERDWDRGAAVRVGVRLVQGWIDGVQGKPRTGTDWAYVAGYEDGGRPGSLGDYAERAIGSCTSLNDLGLRGVSYIPNSLMGEHVKKHLPGVLEGMAEALKSEGRK